MQDNDFLELLNDLQECAPMLTSKFKLLIEVLLKLNWTDRNPTIIKAFKKLIEDLICLHTYHAKLIIDKLVYQFRMSKYFFFLIY